MTALQVATIGAIAGLLSAAIAVPVTIWSTRRAGEDAVNVVNTQQNLETERSRGEFLRARQQALYAQIAKDEQELGFAEVEFVKAIKRNERVAAARTDRDEKLERFNLSKFQISILAPPKTRESFDKLQGAHRIFAENSDLFDQSVARYNSSTLAERPRMIKGIDDLDRKFKEFGGYIDDTEEAFAADARTDMGLR